MYAYNDGDNDGKGTGHARVWAGVVVRNDDDTRCGMSVIRGAECDCDAGYGMNGTWYIGGGMDGMRDEAGSSINHTIQGRPNDRSGYQIAGRRYQGTGGK